MFKRRFTLRRRQTPLDARSLVDPRSGVPARRGPAPMPRMRWYS